MFGNTSNTCEAPFVSAEALDFKCSDDFDEASTWLGIDELGFGPGNSGPTPTPLPWTPSWNGGDASHGNARNTSGPYGIGEGKKPGEETGGGIIGPGK